MNIRLVKRSHQELSADRTKFIMKNQLFRAATTLNHIISNRLPSLIIFDIIHEIYLKISNILKDEELLRMIQKGDLQCYDDLL